MADEFANEGEQAPFDPGFTADDDMSQVRARADVGRRGVDFPAPHWGYYYFQPRPRPWVRPLDFFKAFLSTTLFGEAFRWFVGYRWLVGYVGVTVDTADRFASHRTRSAWFPKIDDRGAYMWEQIDGGRPMYTSEATDIWEREMIGKIVPLHNKAMNDRRRQVTPRPVRFRHLTPTGQRSLDRFLLFVLLAQSTVLVLLAWTGLN